jgi:hypothetical protein
MNVLYLDNLCFLCYEFVIYIYIYIGFIIYVFLMFADLIVMLIES